MQENFNSCLWDAFYAAYESMFTGHMHILSVFTPAVFIQNILYRKDIRWPILIFLEA